MTILATLLAVATSAVAQADCRPIETVDPKDHVWITAKDIQQSGEYCLTQDIKAPRVFDWSGERAYAEGSILKIVASDVMLEMHGHAMKVDARSMAGVNLGYWKEPFSYRRVTIRNGAVENRTATAIQFNAPLGSLLSDFEAIFKSPQTPGMAERQFKEMLAILPKNADAYQKTEHLIEHMTISSSSVSNHIGIHRKAIVMKGAANTIRNSTIEVADGHAAIYLFGPNQIIENNIIIFKGKAAVESAAAIKLHQADGTIIRNNDIIIENSGEDAPKAAISLIDSKNVIAENNRIYGINKLVHAWDDKSNLIDRDNDFRFILRRPWPSDKPGVQ